MHVTMRHGPGRTRGDRSSQRFHTSSRRRISVACCPSGIAERRPKDDGVCRTEILVRARVTRHANSVNAEDETLTPVLKRYVIANQLVVVTIITNAGTL